LKNASFEAITHAALCSAGDTITLGLCAMSPHATILKPIAHAHVLRQRARTGRNASIPTRAHAHVAGCCFMLAAARRGVGIG
jgi:hypothetical protein